jgi:hypothetical protein
MDPRAVDPIADDEILFRRIPASTGWYDSARAPPLEPEAFRPNQQDVSGISLTRQKYRSAAEEAARGRPGKSCYIAWLRAGELRAAGIEVVPSPSPDDPGHAEIPSQNYDQRKSKRAIEQRALLAAALSPKVEGPFVAKA